MIPCAHCGAELNPNGDRPAETHMGAATGECYRCQARRPFRVGVHASGAEIWSHPAHCPAYRRSRELYTWWHAAGCGQDGCEHGRVIRWGGFAGSSHAVQCPACWAQHERHPATVEERRAREAQYAAVQEWDRRMTAEAERRAGREWGSDNYDDPAWTPIVERVLAEGPSRPTGEVAPEFPVGWAGEKKKRKG